MGNKPRKGQGQLKCESCNQITSDDPTLSHCPVCQSSAVHVEGKRKPKERR